MNINISLNEQELRFLYRLVDIRVQEAERLKCSSEMSQRVRDKLTDAIDSFSRIPGRAGTEDK